MNEGEATVIHTNTTTFWVATGRVSLTTLIYKAVMIILLRT